MTAIETLAGPSMLLSTVEARRIVALSASTPEQRTRLGQFSTSEPIAELMAGMVDLDRLSANARLLDPGAGVGSLTAAIVARLATEDPSRSLEAVAYEIDPGLLEGLHATLGECAAAAEASGLQARFHAYGEDYVESALAALLGSGGLFGANGLAGDGFDLVIMNPPYRKIHSASRERRLLAQLGIEVSNLYTAFLALAVRQLALAELHDDVLHDIVHRAPRTARRAHRHDR